MTNRFKQVAFVAIMPFPEQFDSRVWGEDLGTILNQLMTVSTSRPRDRVPHTLYPTEKVCTPCTPLWGTRVGYSAAQIKSIARRMSHIAVRND